MAFLISERSEATEGDQALGTPPQIRVSLDFSDVTTELKADL